MRMAKATDTPPSYGEAFSRGNGRPWSLVTITTLGYGDLSPTSNVGQLASVAEAVVGQIFLVTLVAALVSRFVAKPRHQPGAD